jgi:hypothetical protein
VGAVTAWSGRVGRARLHWPLMTASHYTIGDVTSMLIAAQVFKPDGSIWETDDVGLWFKAIGKKNGVVSRDEFHKTFPDVFERLGMPADRTQALKLGFYGTAIESAPARGLRAAGVTTRLYVIEVVGVFVKFGYSTKVVDRLRQHIDVAHAHDRSAGRIWISQGFLSAAVAVGKERDLKDVHGSREYLRGVDFERVVDSARAVCGDPGSMAADVSDVAALIQSQAEEELKKVVAYYEERGWIRP